MSERARPGFFARLFGKKPPSPSALAAAAAEPVHLGPAEEAWLAQLSTDLSDGKRKDAVGSAEMWQRIDALWKQGHEQLAIDWLEKLLAAPGTPPTAHLALRARLVDYYEQRADLATALPHLEALLSEAEHATRANYLLGEHYRKQGDDDRALRHYEAVLGRDVDYPNVRFRVERIRAARGRLAPPAGETIASGDIAGITAGARYRLVRELGRGATGVVYLARDTELDRDVAVKLLHPHLAGDRQAQALATFFREARVMASLRHPNIVAVLDLDETMRRIVMELGAGGTLRDVLRNRGPRPPRRAVERHAQLLSALAAAHRRGIVHRDLKPANLLYRRDADLPGVEVMLGDFGIAHLPDASGATGAATTRRPAEAVGTLAYMAPEQRRGDAGPKVDLYAAGVMLFEMLTGRTPWPREIIIAGLRKRGDVQLPDAVMKSGPPKLMAAIQEHLYELGDPDPAARPSTSDSLDAATRLRAIAIGEGLPL
jgi:tetratricopeptide (TPR) repeat protein